MNIRHAYLILAHNEWPLLQTLIGCIDDERNDIYVHIDAKVKELPVLRATKSNMVLLNERVNVHWGDVSQIYAELALFKASFKNGPYAYYHLLSGVDLPLKSQNLIHEFFDQHQGSEFVGYSELALSWLSKRKVQRYHVFPEDFRNKSYCKRIIRALFIRVQETFGWKRNRKIDFKKGSNWVSVTNDLVFLLISKECWAKRVFHHTFCCDEFFVQTVCWNSPFRAAIYNCDDDTKGCMRAIGWKNGRLLDWCASDYEELKNSPALFARKFNSRDMDFIEKIVSLTK